MCGIVGIFDYQTKRPIQAELIAAMNHRIAHRGPDDDGYYIQPGIAMGHRRLSIIDLHHGKQPILNESESLVIVYNGEIYNFQELREELSQLGFVFRTKTDTEVVLHAYQAWGERCLEHLQGMFAFAIWDNQTETLFLARDRLGIKPLFYSLLSTGELIFASELKALMIHPHFNFNLNLFAIDEYFAFGYVPEPNSIYRGTYKLNPGHYLTIKRGKANLCPRQYWDVQFDAKILSEKTAVDQCLATLDRIVHSHMISDVSIAAFLSGGVDSSAVVASMCQVTEQIQTCSVAFAESSHDESEYARKVASQYHTDHHDYQLGPMDMDVLDKLSDLYDEPFADSSAIPTYRVCQLARKHSKVVLSGDGGDETLAGYRRYRFQLQEERIKKHLPYALRRPLFGLLAGVYPKMDWAPRFLRAKATFHALSQNTLEAYFHSIALFKDSYRKALYHPDFSRMTQEFHPISVFERHAQHFYGDSTLSLLQYLDIKTYLPGDILTKVDRASMAHGLEVRVPLLDHQWVSWAANLSDSLKIQQGEGKFILKKALEQRLPSDVLYRKKQGFSVPLQKWFKGPLQERVLALKSSSILRDSQMLNLAFIEKLVNQHLQGTFDHSAMIWSLLVFENFYANHLKAHQNRTYYVKESLASV